MRLHRDVDGLGEDNQLGCGLDLTVESKPRGEVLDFGFGSNLLQPRYVVFLIRQRVDRITFLQHAFKLRGELLQHFDARHASRRYGAWTGTEPLTGPTLVIQIAGWDEENLFKAVTSRVEQQDRAGLVKPRQVVKVVFLLVLHQVRGRCRKQDDDTVQLRGQLLPPQFILLERLAFQCGCGECGQQDPGERESFHQISYIARMSVANAARSKRLT